MQTIQVCPAAVSDKHNKSRKKHIALLVLPLGICPVHTSSSQAELVCMGVPGTIASRIAVPCRELRRGEFLRALQLIRSPSQCDIVTPVMDL